jgi:hypothetical protein
MPVLLVALSTRRVVARSKAAEALVGPEEQVTGYDGCPLAGHEPLEHLMLARGEFGQHVEIPRNGGGDDPGELPPLGSPSHAQVQRARRCIQGERGHVGQQCRCIHQMDGIEDENAHAVFLREAQHIGYLDADATQHAIWGRVSPSPWGSNRPTPSPFRFTLARIAVEVPGQSSMASTSIDGTSHRTRRTVQNRRG